MNANPRSVSVRSAVVAVLVVVAGLPGVANADTRTCANGYVALTFDDGPSPTLTPPILDALRRHDAVATFFPIGTRAASHPDLIRRAWAEGHALANHSWDHPWFTSLSDLAIQTSLQRAHAALQAAGAQPLKLYRPPYGATSARVRAAAAAIGFTEIMWTVDPYDYRSTSTFVRDHVLARLRDGAVILFHDGTAKSTAVALDSILQGIHARGFCTALLNDEGQLIPPAPAVRSSGVNLCPPDKRCDTVAFRTSLGEFIVWESASSGEVSRSFAFGNPGDVALSGDWNGSGVKTPGVYRPATGLAYLRNANRAGPADVTFSLGSPGDILLAGDWNGDGRDTVSFYRPSEARFYIFNRLGANGERLGAHDYSFIFGNPGDRPFSGDFNGNGVDTIGLHRPTSGLVYLRNSNTTGIADRSFIFGNPGDILIAGDWNGDGTDTVAVYRPRNGILYLRNSNTQGSADAWAWAGRMAGVIGVRE